MSVRSEMTPTAAERVEKCWLTYGGTMDDEPNCRALDAGLVTQAIQAAEFAAYHRGFRDGVKHGRIPF